MITCFRFATMTTGIRRPFAPHGNTNSALIPFRPIIWRSSLHRIANPDDYRPPDGIELPPVFDPEAWAKNMLQRFVDTLDSGNMPAAIDNLQRATTTSRGLYPRNEALVMLAYVYLIETGREVTKRSLWLHVNERCKHLGIAPPHKRTRPRLLKKLGLDTLPKRRMVR